MVDGLTIDILGPPCIRVGGRSVELRGRALLVVLRLVVAGPNPVSTPRLRADVWGTAGSDGAVRVTLTRVRRALGDAAIVRHQHGYLLAPAKVDAHRFTDLAARGRDRSVTIERRIATYDEALEQWRGAAYEGVEPLPWVDIDTTRLRELHRQVVDDRLELLSLVEDADRLISELSGALAEEPLRERRAELLALALYRSGRQSEALSVLQRCADDLREQLGLEPSPSLCDLEHRILVHDLDLLDTPLKIRATAAADVESLLRTATSLTRAEAYAEALEILDQAEQRSRQVNDRRSLAESLLTRAVHHSMSGTGDPRPLVDEARTIARQLRDGPLLARCAITRLGSGLTTDVGEGLIDLLEPLELLPSRAPERVDLMCAAAVMVVLTSGSDSGNRLLDAATELHDSQQTARSGAVLASARCIAAAAERAPADDVEALAIESLRFAQQTDDPVVAVVTTHALIRARYTRGDLDGVDELLGPLLRAGRSAMLPFAIARVSLCRTSHALARGELSQVELLLDETRELQRRLRTLNTGRALLAQRAMLYRELDRLGELRDQLRDAAAPGNDYWPVFAALLALADPTTPSPTGFLEEIGDDGSTLPFAALAVEVADRRDDPALAEWSLPHLEAAGDAVISSGLGTVLFGFATHHAGLARKVVGDLDEAVDAFGRAIELSQRNGAHLWLDHSRIELVDTLRGRGRPGDLARARRLDDGDVTAARPRTPRSRR